MVLNAAPKLVLGSMVSWPAPVKPDVLGRVLLEKTSPPLVMVVAPV